MWKKRLSLLVLSVLLIGLSFSGCNVDPASSDVANVQKKSLTNFKNLSFDASSKVTLYYYIDSTYGDHTMYPHWYGGTVGSYKYQGVKVYANSASASGRIPLYLYYNSQHHDLTFYPWVGSSYGGWSYQNVKIYVYASPGDGRIPLYLYYNSSRVDFYFSPKWLGSSYNGYAYQNYKVYVYKPINYSELADYGYTPASYGQSTTEFTESADYTVWKNKYTWIHWNLVNASYNSGMNEFNTKMQSYEHDRLYGTPPRQAAAYEATHYLQAQKDFYELLWKGVDCSDAGKIKTFNMPDPPRRLYYAGSYYWSYAGTHNVNMRYTYLNLWNRVKAFERAYYHDNSLHDTGNSPFHNFTAMMSCPATGWPDNTAQITLYLSSFGMNLQYRSVIYASCDDSYFVQKNADVVFAVCFAKGTKISTPDGFKNIEKLKKGDLVLSCNIKTGEKAYKPIVVIDKLRTFDPVTLDINGERIVTTPTHPFWTGKFETSQEKYPLQWTEAQDLNKGSILVNSSFDQIRLTSAPVKKTVTKGRTVYNITVKDWHTYFVGKNRILVHNGDKCRVATILNKFEYFMKLHSMGGLPGTVRSELPIPWWMDTIPVFSDMYLFPCALADIMKDYGNHKISGGEAVWRMFKEIGSHYVDNYGKEVFPNTASAIGFANAAYDVYKDQIPANERR